MSKKFGQLSPSPRWKSGHLHRLIGKVGFSEFLSKICQNLLPGDQFPWYTAVWSPPPRSPPPPQWHGNWQRLNCFFLSLQVILDHFLFIVLSLYVHWTLCSVVKSFWHCVIEMLCRISIFPTFFKTKKLSYLVKSCPFHIDSNKEFSKKSDPGDLAQLHSFTVAQFHSYTLCDVH